ncbi:hypothetical protein B0T16DRAFT_41635 [Cercophora newfieldiana]|uniref:Uncharacterized protein n=1 Tax=Cercophora newfieldiana TaxID=92897 RepID=A0AA39YQ25_9PEZI|nr:hypothetical protein B0T16DRAFT_41635 [Cercophora newfieldiana]
MARICMNISIQVQKSCCKRCKGGCHLSCPDQPPTQSLDRSRLTLPPPPTSIYATTLKSSATHTSLAYWLLFQVFTHFRV